MKLQSNYTASFFVVALGMVFSSLDKPGAGLAARSKPGDQAIKGRWAAGDAADFDGAVVGLR